MAKPCSVPARRLELSTGMLISVRHIHNKAAWQRENTYALVRLSSAQKSTTSSFSRDRHSSSQARQKPGTPTTCAWMHRRRDMEPVLLGRRRDTRLPQRPETFRGGVLRGEVTSAGAKLRQFDMSRRVAGQARPAPEQRPPAEISCSKSRARRNYLVPGGFLDRHAATRNHSRRVRGVVDVGDWKETGGQARGYREPHRPPKQEITTQHRGFGF